MTIEEYLTKFSLDEDQIKAVCNSNNTSLVVAGAGSGKTRTIIGKILWEVLNGNVEKWQVLAVTFTNKAAEEMKERLKKLLGDDSEIDVRTFHSYCANFLRRNSLSAGLNRAFSIYDEEDSVRLLQSAIPTHMTQNEVKPIVKNILEAKERGFNPDNYLMWSRSTTEFEKYFRLYEEGLKKSGAVDFAGLINTTINLLTNNEEIRNREQRRIRLLLVDEFQDTNEPQFKLVQLLKTPFSMLFAVGDDDQMIYTFRGANLMNMLEFKQSFPEAVITPLGRNYRSLSPIIDAAASLISHNRQRTDKRIFSTSPGNAKPEVFEFESDLDEADYLSELASRMTPEDGTLAVLFRTNRQSELFERALVKRSVRFATLKASSFYSRIEIKDALALLCLVINPKDVASFLRVVNKPSRLLGPKIQNQVITGGNENLIEGLMNIPISGMTKKNRDEFVEAINTAHNRLTNPEAHRNSEIVKDLLVNTGLYAYYKAEDEKEMITEDGQVARLDTFIEGVDDYQPGIEGITEFLEKISLQGAVESQKNVRIILSTIHNAKGLEFDSVLISGCEEGVLPYCKESDGASESEYEEERRLTYVAMTRARKKLFMSFVNTRYMNGMSMSQKMSRFISEIDPNLLTFHLDMPSSHARWGVQSSKSGFVKPNYHKYNGGSFSDSNHTASQPPKREVNKAGIKFWQTRAQQARNSYLSQYSSSSASSHSYLQDESSLECEFRVGDRVIGEIGGGQVVSVRTISGRVCIDVLFDSGRKSTFVADSGRVKKA